MAEATTIVGLIDACIALTGTIMRIGQAARDANGLPDKLAELFKQLPALQNLFERARESNSKPGARSCAEAEPVLENCKEALNELGALFKKICPEDDSNHAKRVWKGVKAEICGRNSRLQELWQRIERYLNILAEKEIFVIGDSLSSLKSAFESLAAEDAGKYSYQGSGNQIVTEGGGVSNITGGGSNAKSFLQGANFTPGPGGTINLPHIGDTYITKMCCQSSSVIDMNTQSLHSQISVTNEIPEKTKGTCDWIYTHTEYKKWCRCGGLLWIKGRPGTGKSTLMGSILSNAVGTSLDSTVFISFLFSRRQTPMQRSQLSFYASCLRQMLSHDSALRLDFEQCARVKCDFGMPDWSESELSHKLKEYVQTYTRTRKLCLHIDALDEAETGTTVALLNYLRQLCPSASSLLSVCVSCRPWPDQVSRAHWDYCIDMREGNADDIVKFLDSSFECYVETTNQLKMTRVKNQIATRASGVFQWAALVARRVITNRALEENDLLNAIKRTPKKLDEVYQSMFDRFKDRANQGQRTQALQIMRWITFAARPLSLTELRHAVVLDVNDFNSRTASLNQYQASEHWCASDDEILGRIRELSSGLVLTSTRDECDKLQFDHESVREYMISQGLSFLEHCRGEDSGNDLKGLAHRRLMMSCLRFMMATINRDRNLRSQDIQEFKALPFASYASLYCKHHMRQAETHGQSLEYVINLTEWPSNKVWTKIAVMEATEEETNRTHVDHLDQYHNTTLQHCAAEYGLHSVMEALKPQINSWRSRFIHYGRLYNSMVDVKMRSYWNNDINADDASMRTPLYLAAEQGDTKMVDTILHMKGVVVEMAVLGAASRQGNPATVDRLLKVGKFDENAKRKALWWAAATGHDEVVEMLLLRGAFKVPEEALEIAYSVVDRGPSQWKIIKLLIEALKPSYNWILALRIIAHRQIELLRFWLDKSALKENDFALWQFLSLAARYGNSEMVALLVDLGAEVNREYRWYEFQRFRDVIPHAVTTVDGNEEVTELSLGWGTGLRGLSNALSQAATERKDIKRESGRHEMIERFLVACANVNARAAYGTRHTPLQEAAGGGHLEVVNMLLSHGAKIDAAPLTQDSNTTLQQAAKYGRLEVLEELIKRHPDVNMKRNDSRTALHMAAEGRYGCSNNRLKIVKLLLDAGAEACPYAPIYKTPLHVAQYSWDPMGSEAGRQQTELLIDFLVSKTPILLLHDLDRRRYPYVCNEHSQTSSS